MYVGARHARSEQTTGDTGGGRGDVIGSVSLRSLLLNSTQFLALADLAARHKGI
jgi:hypothetical protein